MYLLKRNILFIEVVDFLCIVFLECRNSQLIESFTDRGYLLNFERLPLPNKKLTIVGRAGGS
jgi:hypothetical protein